MDSRIKVEDEDDGWNYVPAVGMVRSGPRRNHHRNQESLARLPQFLPAHTRVPSLDRDTPIPSRLPNSPSRHESTSSGHLGDDERSIVKTEGDADSDIPQLNYMENLSRLFGEHHRQQNSDVVTQTERVSDAFTDERRSHHHLPSRRSRPTFTPETDGSLFFSERSPSSDARPASTIPEDRNRRKRRRRDSETPPPPMPPPMFRTVAPRGCRCPIGFACPRKDNLKSDCRTLTVEYPQWRRWQQHGRDVEVADLPPEDLPDLAALQKLSEIVRLLDNVDQQPPVPAPYRRIRGWISYMRQHDVNEDLLGQSRALIRLEEFLSDQHQPRRIARRVPWDVYEDLLFFCRKWRRGDFSMYARRGFIRNGNGAIVLDPGWPHDHRANRFGHNGLVNGQIWTLRMELFRDGGHGRMMGGIYGTLKDGAYAIVMGLHAAGEYYADVDCGIRIWYLGTSRPPDDPNAPASNLKETQNQQQYYADVDPTTATKVMMRSHETRNPVRVFRSCRAAKVVKGRPEKGYRYDGLYQVVDYDCVNARRAIYQFEMLRIIPDQGPLRNHDRPEHYDWDTLAGSRPGAGVGRGRF